MWKTTFSGGKLHFSYVVSSRLTILYTVYYGATQTPHRLLGQINGKHQNNDLWYREGFLLSFPVPSPIPWSGWGFTKVSPQQSLIMIPIICLLFPFHCRRSCAGKQHPFSTRCHFGWVRFFIPHTPVTLVVLVVEIRFPRALDKPSASQTLPRPGLIVWVRGFVARRFTCYLSAGKKWDRAKYDAPLLRVLPSAPGPPCLATI